MAFQLWFSGSLPSSGDREQTPTAPPISPIPYEHSVRTSSQSLCQNLTSSALLVVPSSQGARIMGACGITRHDRVSHTLKCQPNHRVLGRVGTASGRHTFIPHTNTPTLPIDQSIKSVDNDPHGKIMLTPLEHIPAHQSCNEKRQYFHTRRPTGPNFPFTGKDGHK